MKEFKVGDKIWNPHHGNGIVRDIHPQPYAVNVCFGTRRESFTNEGREHEDDTAPTLFHGHDLTLKAVKPKTVWMNIYWRSWEKEFVLGNHQFISKEEAQQNRHLYIVKTLELTIPEEE